MTRRQHMHQLNVALAPRRGKRGARKTRTLRLAKLGLAKLKALGL